MVDVSIIIVNYNTSALLKACIESIYHFTKDISFEIIVVDNASDDFNYEEFVKLFPKVKFIVNEQNLGFASGNNVALSHVKGKYILFLNNDTLLINNVIKNVFEFAESYTQSVFVGVQLLNKDLTKQESVVEFPSVWNGFTENFFLYKLFPKSKVFNKYYQNEINLNQPTEVDVIRGAFMFCPTEEIKKLDGFDSRFFFYSEETDLCYRFKKNGGKIFFLPNEKIIHYGGVATDKNLWFKFKNQTIGKIQFYQKHFSGFRFIVAMKIHFVGLFLRGLLNSILGLLLLNKNIFMKGFYFFKQMFVYPKNVFKNR